MSLTMKVNPNESPPLVLSEFVLERQLVATVIYYRCSFFCPISINSLTSLVYTKRLPLQTHVTVVFLSSLIVRHGSNSVSGMLVSALPAGD
jgi:cytochrome oxidase Cu insertion factor (SCO1/SenC/PrrC family)